MAMVEGSLAAVIGFPEGVLGWWDGVWRGGKSETDFFNFFFFNSNSMDALRVRVNASSRILCKYTREKIPVFFLDDEIE